MPSSSVDAVKAKLKIREAIGALRDLGFPRAQLNERSALVLLTLLGLTPDSPWSSALNYMLGITQMMQLFKEHYGKSYAPNTRETVRRQTVHQFVQAGLVVANPDNPGRPVNSPHNVYEVAPSALKLLRTYGSTVWPNEVSRYLAEVGSLKAKYDKDRKLKRIPVRISGGKAITLSPGAHSALIKAVVEEFCSRFTPGGKLLYVGDTGVKFSYFDRAGLAGLGVKVDKHGKMPDVAVYRQDKKWLVLIEAVTSHGPVNPKRRTELTELCRGCSVHLVFVTAFLTRHDCTQYLTDISWETDVWIAEAPSHMIHFDGEKFLGPS